MASRASLPIALFALAFSAVPGLADTPLTAFRTLSVAKIAGPVDKTDIRAHTAVHSNTGEWVGKVVSTVLMSDGTHDVVVQVQDGSPYSDEKIVTMPRALLGYDSNGDLMVNMSGREFAAIVAAQNPA